MPNNASPSTSPVWRPEDTRPFTARFAPTIVVTDGPPVLSNPNPGPAAGNPGSGYTAPAFFQPQGPRSRSIVPVPGTVYGDVAEASMTQATLGVLMPCYPPAQQVYEFPVYYPGVGYVNSANVKPS